IPEHSREVVEIVAAGRAAAGNGVEAQRARATTAGVENGPVDFWDHHAAPKSAPGPRQRFAWAATEPGLRSVYEAALDHLGVQNGIVPIPPGVLDFLELVERKAMDDTGLRAFCCERGRIGPGQAARRKRCAGECDPRTGISSHDPFPHECL